MQGNRLARDCNGSAAFALESLNRKMPSLQSLWPEWIDKCKVTGYTSIVKIRNFLHKGLKRLYEEDDPTGLPPPCIDKLRKMIVFLDEMAEVNELHDVPV